jgi:predicted TIM-barrel fold metal-dependent hydrolase
MVKIHPPTMDVDPGARRLAPFYNLCKERRVIVMVHTGHEHAADIASVELGDPGWLELALDAGCIVIAAHAGMGAFFDREAFFHRFQALVRKYPNLYCDTAVMGSMLRWRNLPQLLSDAAVAERVVHGSDYPFPANGLVFWNRLTPRVAARILQERNLIKRDLELKRALGVPEAAFARGARLLGLG